MLEWVDKRDLKSLGHQGLCGFKSHWKYKMKLNVLALSVAF